MLTKDTRVLISYSASTQQDARSSMLATQLSGHLYNEMRVQAVVRERSQKMPASDAPYDWLILVHSQNSLADEKKEVDDALKQVLQRQMQGIMVITPTASDLPAEWDTIPRYDASAPDNESRMLRNIIQDMQYVKVPHTTKAGRLQRSPSGGRSPLETMLSSRLAIAASLILVLLIVLGGGVPLYLNRFAPHPASTLSSVALTATTGTHLKTQTAIASSTPSPQDKQTRFRDITQKRPNITGFRPQETWDQNDTCITIETSYKASAVAASQGYTPCMAQKTTLQDFAYQISMNINGDAGGVIFRSQNNLQAFYRASLTLNQQGLLFTAVHCSPKQCANNNPYDGQVFQHQLSYSPDQLQVVTLTIIAQGNSIDLYVNGQIITTLQDPAPATGQIGVYAASLSQPTTVIFTDLKIWLLPPPPTTIPPEPHNH